MNIKKLFERIKKFITDLSRELEIMEFSSHSKSEKKENVKEYIEENRKIKDYHIDFIDFRFTVNMSTSIIFKGIYGFEVNEAFEYSVETDNDENKTIMCILKESTPYHKLVTILLKTYSLIRYIKKITKINDNETEAYLYGFIVSNICKDFMGIYTFESLLSFIKAEPTVEWRLERCPEFKYCITSIVSKENISEISKTAVATVITKKGYQKQLLIMPKKKHSTIWDDINTWSHELYHITRNTHGILGDDKYIWPEQILREYIENSLPVLKYMIGEKLHD